MRSTLRPNIKSPYSLHDQTVAAFEVQDSDLLMHLKTGMIRTYSPAGKPQGHVEFQSVQWDFSYVYIFDHTGNTGNFSGEKLFLRDFILTYPACCFTICDETYGYNMTKYSGDLMLEGRRVTCMIELYHEGDMFFVDETEYTGMQEVILSHDSEAMLCLVPAEVACNLDSYCLEFGFSWVWNGPENGRFLKRINDNLVGAMFGADEFIDYLNRWAFPGCGAKIIRRLGCYDYDLPAEYASLPRHNF